MKKTLIYILALSVLFICADASSQEEGLPEGQAQAVQAPMPEAGIDFKLIFIGTKYYVDENAVRSGLARLTTVRNLAPVVVSQMHNEYTGTFYGTEEALIADIAGLAMNRFEVLHSKDKSKKLVITLKKLAAEIPQG